MKNKEVWIRGYGCGLVVEELLDMVLVESARGCVWVDLRTEYVEVLG